MDLGAGEAWYIARHQELADFCWYFRRPLPAEDAALHSRIEYVQNLWDFANRTIGGAISGRVNISPQKVIIQAGDIINLSDRLPHYKADKKAAVAASIADLEKAYLDCIGEMRLI
jgi:alpha-D-ribose 1-methylphosphonate 5-triphosphate synthase subunit PhnL